MLRRIIIALTLPLLTFVGCRTTSMLTLRNLSMSSAEVQEVVQTHHSKIKRMTGEGRISVETPGFAQSGSFVLALQKPDSVLINIRGPFGIKVGLVLVTRNDFLFYNSIENKLITGSSSIENLNRILHVQVSFDDLLNIFAGGTFLSDDLHPPDESRVEDDRFVFIYAARNSSRRYWIDPTTLVIEKIQHLDRSGKLTLEQSFSSFEDTDGITMPYLIRVTRPKTRQMLALSYSSISVNKDQLKFIFTIPQNAERIRW